MRTGVLFVCSFLWLALPAPVSASIGSKLDDWFNGQNYTNQTAPGVYEGQSARYFSMGGYSRRNDLNGEFELFSVQTPRISAGCGGIDVYAGGFSAIDSDALMNNIRAIGQASASLAFMLAIQTVSPMLSDIMKQIQSWANEFNKWGMDSCQAAEQLVGGSLEMFGVDKGNCIVKAMNNQGLNYRDAEDLCTNEAGGESVVNGPGGPNQIDFVRGNLAWYVLMKDPFFSTDMDLAQMAMNITGTVIIEKENPSVADSPLIPISIPSAVDNGELTDRFRNIYQGLMEGQQGAMQLYRCQGNVSADRDNGCASVSARPQAMQVTTQGLRTRVQNSFRSIMQKVQTDSALSQEEQGLISSTRIPVYRFLTAISAAFPNAIDIEQRP
jgi:conjugative transfer pilus assembly protein TraH